jgi:glutaredoxin
MDDANSQLQHESQAPPLEPPEAELEKNNKDTEDNTEVTPEDMQSENKVDGGTVDDGDLADLETTTKKTKRVKKKTKKQLEEEARQKAEEEERKLKKRRSVPQHWLKQTVKNKGGVDIGELVDKDLVEKQSRRTSNVPEHLVKDFAIFLKQSKRELRKQKKTEMRKQREKEVQAEADKGDSEVETKTNSKRHAKTMSRLTEAHDQSEVIEEEKIKDISEEGEQRKGDADSDSLEADLEAVSSSLTDTSSFSYEGKTETSEYTTVTDEEEQQEESEDSLEEHKPESGTSESSTNSNISEQDAELFEKLKQSECGN